MRKLIVFDLDGTLVDTTNLSRESFFGVVKNYGVDADALWPLYNKTNGLPFRERITMVMPEFISRADEILAGITASHIKNIKKMVTAYPDIVETLEKIRIKKAILTSRVGESAFQIIKDILNHPFDYILTPEMTKLHKPNPEPSFHLFLPQPLITSINQSLGKNLQKQLFCNITVLLIVCIKTFRTNSI